MFDILFWFLYHYINSTRNLLPLFLNFFYLIQNLEITTLICRIPTFAMRFYDGNFTQQKI